MQCSAVHVRANPPGRAKLASKLAALNLAAQVRASQRGPVRTTPAAIYLQQQVKVRTLLFFFTKSSLDINTHTRLDNKSWEQVLSDQWFLFIKREMSCPGTCAVPFLCHPTCVGAHDFSHGPPMTGSWSPLCHPIKKILESPLYHSSNKNLYLI